MYKYTYTLLLLLADNQSFNEIWVNAPCHLSVIMGKTACFALGRRLTQRSAGNRFIKDRTIGSKFFVGPRVTPGKVYGWSNYQKFVKNFFLHICKICFTMLRKRTCSQCKWKMGAKRPNSLVKYNWLTNKFDSFAVLGVKWREIDEKTFGLQVFSIHIPKPKNQSINQSLNQ